jgi:hypothetical protein
VASAVAVAASEEITLTTTKFLQKLILMPE